ncbi:MAG: restriction endonuclease subunit S, partial [Ignavibacteria bacterium]|nr:restriction endonuclease subunit S [Ignavibacteria bacterium]
TSSTGVPMITQKQVSNFKIPLPPTKAEQTAIATTLNDADKLIKEIEKLIAKKKMIKQGVMQELLKPKEGWEAQKLGVIANIRRGASPRPIKDTKWFSDKGRGWIRISDVTNSNVYLNKTTQYLSEDGIRNSVAVDKGDLIMSICATIGIPIIINIPSCIHDGFVLFRNYEKYLDLFFLYFFLQANTEVFSDKGQPGTQKNLNTTIVGDIEINYPSLVEQRLTGGILRDIDIEITSLEKKLDKFKMLKQGMMQNLLTGKIRLV